MIEYRALRVALLGAGSVGAQVARLILQESAELAARVGAGLELVGIAVRDPTARRDADLPARLFTTDAESLILGADIVIELMGGIEPARTLILQALGSGADVVTANKALLATHGAELAAAADQVGAQLSYEAAVAGAIPIVRPLRESLAGDRVERILGIVNGTTNFVLDRMHTDGEDLQTALAAAQRLGYAEADPSADIDGFDAAQKAAILAGLAFHTRIPLDAVHREGIGGITRAQVAAAVVSGHVIKLLAICERIGASPAGEAGVSVRVYPALVPAGHPLAAVHGAYNAVFVEAASAGDLMFYGAGAGGVETASAVLGDLVSVARRHVAGGPGLIESAHAALPVLPIGRAVTRYQITLEVVDRPGVLARVAHIISAAGVSVEAMRQSAAGPAGAPAPAGPKPETAAATLVIETHTAAESALASIVRDLSADDAVLSVTSVLRVEGS